MRLLRAHRWHALLIALLVGFLALTLHDSVHSVSDQQSCVLCSSHFKPSHAIVPVVQVPTLRSTVEFTESLVPRLQPTRRLISYFQRAPPVLN